MKWIFGWILAAILVLLFVSSAPAVGPYNANQPDGTSSFFVQVADSTRTTPLGNFSIYPPDADITISYWRWDPGLKKRIRVNNGGGPPENTHGTGIAFVDSVETVYAGTISRPDFMFHWIYGTRSASTPVKIEWFQ